MTRSTGDDAATRRPPGMLEDEVLAVLWSGDRPMTPAEVQLDLDDRLTYTADLDPRCAPAPAGFPAPRR